MKYQTHILKQIMDALKKQQVSKLEDIERATKMSRKDVTDRLNYYARRGVIYKLGRGVFSLDPNAVYKPEPKSKDPHIETLYKCMNDMVKCKT